MMERTESSRMMRGAREVFCEYILELHDRKSGLKITDFQLPVWNSIQTDRLGRQEAVGHDGGMHVIAGEYHCRIEEARDSCLVIVLSEIDSVSCL